jgi:hypothetical protein
MTVVSTASTCEDPAPLPTATERMGDTVSTSGSAVRSSSMVGLKPPWPHDPESTT